MLRNPRKIYDIIFNIILFPCISLITVYGQSISETEKYIQKALDKHCIDCHGVDDPDGEISLDNFIDLQPNLKLDILNQVEEQVSTVKV